MVGVDWCNVTSNEGLNPPSPRCSGRGGWWWWWWCCCRHWPWKACSVRNDMKHRNSCIAHIWIRGTSLRFALLFFCSLDDEMMTTVARHMMNEYYYSVNHNTGLINQSSRLLCSFVSRPSPWAHEISLTLLCLASLLEIAILCLFSHKKFNVKHIDRCDMFFRRDVLLVVVWWRSCLWMMRTTSDDTSRKKSGMFNVILSYLLRES